MAGLNKIMLIGNAGRDPELRYTPQGTPVASFSLAVNRRRGQGGQEETEWFDIVCWNRTAEVANQFVRKGKQVYVEGNLRTRTFEGRDGQKQFRVEVNVNELVLLGGQGGGPGSLPADDFAGQGGGDTDPDDLPF